MAQTKQMLSKQALQTREILSKQALKIAKQAEEHERFINKVYIYIHLENLFISVCVCVLIWVFDCV